MSPSATIGIITKLSSQYDDKVLHWASELKKICMYICICICIYIYIYTVGPRLSESPLSEPSVIRTLF